MAVEETWAQTQSVCSLDTWQRHTLDDTLHQMAGMLIICLHKILLDMVTRTECNADRSVRGILLQNHETAMVAARHVLAADSRNLDRTLVVGSTQPQMSTRDIFWGGGVKGERRPRRRADNLTTFMCRLS
jgi:hypothetical protein